MVNSPKLLSGRYRLIESLGESGTSIVWRAYDEVLRRRVAVKLLAAGPRDASQLHAGVQVAALLNHPNVSAVYDYGVAGDEPFVVMELVDGVSLADRLTRGPLPWRGAVEVCAYVAAALSAAHARRLVHSDIRPGSIMLTEDGVKVLDFGIAAVTSSRQAAGPADDVYALGMLLFSVLTGQRPADRKAGLLRGDPGLTPLPLIPGMPWRSRRSTSTASHQIRTCAPPRRRSPAGSRTWPGYGSAPSTCGNAPSPARSWAPSPARPRRCG